MLLATLGLFAQAGSDLTTYTTRHYKVHTNLERQEAVDYGRHMDLIFEDYADRFRGFRSRGRDRNNLFLLRTRDDYIRHMAKYGFDASASGGVFFERPQISGLATWVEDRPKSETLATLQHEGFHQFAAKYIGPTLPLWVNEGLATYFEQSKVIAGKVKTGIAEPIRVDIIQQIVENENQIPFHQLLNLSSHEWHQNMLSGSREGSLQYTESWAVVYFLIHGDKGKYQRVFEKYLQMLSTGRSHAQAYDKVFGPGSEKMFEQRWEQFVSQMEPDEYSAALDEMMFLAFALNWLHKNQPDAVPQDIEQLKKTLEQIQFRTTRSSGAGGPSFEIKATDKSVWHYTDARDQTHGYTLLPPQGDVTLPRITAEQLRPQPVVTWEKREDGSYTPNMSFQ